MIITNKKTLVKNHLIVGCLISIVSILVPVYLVNVRTDPEKYERFYFFISSENVNKTSIYQKINKHLNGIKIFDCYSYSTKNSFFNNYYMTQGEMDSDILILSTNVINEQRIRVKMNIIDIPGYEYYTIENVNYGIKVYDTKTESGFIKDCITYEQNDYYLFINKSSTHCGQHDYMVSNVLRELLK